ncbi:serine/threonine-protein kinase [Sphaerisporangium corydalis]|uniref:serine/threonine-protein kinase n=1 Tax=Sphaerisporangium corydalis TaxID=1441875 RepID=UPI0021D371F0|nr:protein kinase [Sphaerisporangium corydalis]
MDRAGIEPLRPSDPPRIGPYRLLGRLGQGGMGTVYLAEAPTGRSVAVKVVKAEFTVDEGFAKRFHAEVSNARRVASFCTAQVLDNGNADDGTPYMVTEYIAGTPLSAQITRYGALEAGTLHGVALGVAAALAAIHVAGLVHRDLKPANVILSMSGPRVIDFGIARALDATHGVTQSGELLGSPGWWAPEQVRGEDITPAADIFAWGCLVAYAGNGRHPYGRGDMITLAGRVLTGKPDLGTLPAPLDRLVRLATHGDPQRRPSAQDLLIALVGGDLGRPEFADPPTLAAPVDPPTLVATEMLNESWEPPANVAAAAVDDAVKAPGGDAAKGTGSDAAKAPGGDRTPGGAESGAAKSIPGVGSGGAKSVPDGKGADAAGGTIAESGSIADTDDTQPGLVIPGMAYRPKLTSLPNPASPLRPEASRPAPAGTARPTAPAPGGTTGETSSPAVAAGETPSSGVTTGETPSPEVPDAANQGLADTDVSTRGLLTPDAPTQDLPESAAATQGLAGNEAATRGLPDTGAATRDLPGPDGSGRGGSGTKVIDPRARDGQTNAGPPAGLLDPGPGDTRPPVGTDAVTMPSPVPAQQGAPPSRSRKWLIPALTVLVGLLVTGGVLAVVANNRSTVRATDVSAVSARPTPAPTHENDVGRRYTAGSFIEDPQFVVPRPARCGLTSYPGADAPQGLFCEVRWTLVNPGGTPATTAATAPTLVDDAGGEHEAAGVSTAVPGTLEPGAKVDGVFVYDLPKGRGAATLKMRISDSQTIEVRL